MMVSLLWLACNVEKETDPEMNIEQSVDDIIETPEETPPEINESIVGNGSVYPEEEPTYRHKKRMKIAHIKTSMERISGGITWEINGQNKWDEYSDTLGVPDYQFRVREDRSISIMFQKFLDDAAAHTCTEWIQQEVDGTERLFFEQIEPSELDLAKIRLNMLSLRRRFHGQVSAVDDPMIDSLVDLHYTVVQRTNSLEQAWTSVCIGLFTHPDFFMY